VTAPYLQFLQPQTANCRLYMREKSGIPIISILTCREYSVVKDRLDSAKLNVSLNCC
jgi:hypothetical protein